MKQIELKANLGLVVRGDYSAINAFMEGIEALLNETGVQLVHKHASASKLWIKEGDDMNGTKSP